MPPRILASEPSGGGGRGAIVVNYPTVFFLAHFWYPSLKLASSQHDVR